jgi:hypothetical protein
MTLTKPPQFWEELRGVLKINRFSFFCRKPAIADIFNRLPGPDIETRIGAIGSEEKAIDARQLDGALQNGGVKGLRRVVIVSSGSTFFSSL